MRKITLLMAALICGAWCATAQTTEKGYEYVDLGLPSGLKWATCNVGATAPEAYGNYYAWGETEPKTTYDWNTYRWCNGSYDTQTKYCTDSGYGTVDNKTVLDLADDAARANWGGAWHMPTDAEWTELRENCEWTWTSDYNGTGVAGRIVTSKTNGNHIFLPAAGFRGGDGLGSVGCYGLYWSSSLHTGYPNLAWYVSFYSGRVDGRSSYRYYGLSVRAVFDPTELQQVDLGLPSGTKWANLNVGATTPEDYGDYYAWGETEPKTTYSWSTYKWCNGRYDTQTKYCTSGRYGTVDDKTVLELADDAARANWGGQWRMPTDAEWTELRENCTWTWTTLNGVNGYKVKGANGNSIFLPAAGYRGSDDLNNAGGNGFYWSSSLYTDGPLNAWGVYFCSNNLYGGSLGRYCGRSVRPVLTTYSITLAAENGTVTGAGTYPQGTAVTLTATANEGYYFVQWSDGNSETPRIITVTEDVALTAVFAVNPVYNAVGGVFSVAADKQVQFSAGNLQCTINGTDTAWAFAAHQYDMLGTANVNGSALANTIDLFGWSGNTATAKWGISLSIDDNDYSGDFADWGQNIGDGNTWRTLTNDEWTYLRSSRANAANLMGVARINLDAEGTTYANGLILLPDTWTCPEDVTFKSGLSSTYGEQAYADYQTFTLEQWQKLEAAGAVFLPASGGRNGLTIYDVQYYGYYWSATPHSSLYAYHLYFHSRSADSYDNRRYDGQAVRLVQDYSEPTKIDDLIINENLGVYAIDGRIVCAVEFRIYDLLGRDVTRENGSLHGIYVVKSDEMAVKVVVK